MISVYPDRAADRTRWIRELRGPRNTLDPAVPYAYFVENEIAADGRSVRTGIILLTNRECPFTCLMCDLWQNTLTEAVPAGSIAGQIRLALAAMGPVEQLKLYNAGSFFDPQAIPPAEDDEIARLVQYYERVIVEAHPAFIGPRCIDFAKRIGGKLEVAIGLETCHEPTLNLLNKKFKLSDFQRAADLLKTNDIDIRTFLLVRPPFMSEEEGVEWACKSVDYSFDAGATACCVIPTRGGNGAMEALAVNGDFQPPKLRSLETVHEYGLQLKRGRVFSDLWDIDKFFKCDCHPGVATRLRNMNDTQTIPATISCVACGTA
ncbi:MAG: radical SAM protein [Chthonomonadales bacterium]